MASKFQIVRGIEQRPHATILTGRSGIGKTFLASTIPNVFFICIEQGLKGASPEHVDDLPRFERPRSLGEFIEMLGEVKSTSRSNGIRHVAIDSLSGLERLVNKHTCNQESVAHMEAKDFKKVWAATMPVWQRVQDNFDSLRDDAGTHVWLIAHGQETKTSTVDGDMFQTWDLALQGSGDSLSALRQMWRGWADHVLFIDWDADVTKGTVSKRTVGKYKSRILRTRETPSHYAKNRANLPPVLPATWVDLSRAMAAGTPASATRLRSQLSAILVQLSDQDRASVEADLAKAKSIASLSAALSRAQGMLSATRIEAEDDASSTPANDTPVFPAEPESFAGQPEPMPTTTIAEAAREVADASVEADVLAERVRQAFGAATSMAEIEAAGALGAKLDKARKIALKPAREEALARLSAVAEQGAA